ncbi:MAG: endo alpha-1,4 polygalactosaminidase [Desulfobulbus propionicus]|nr:MAG: endo alpha-1,4 polygalactosaminidase [Desulfobulbus propionicus]
MYLAPILLTLLTTTPLSWYSPRLSDTWQWQLSGTVNTSYHVDIYDIDLFDTSEKLIHELHEKDKKVICYFSAGSYERWRPDSHLFQERELGKTLDGWEDEKWVDIRSKNIEYIIQQRLDLAQKKGCDGVEPDNIDAYTNDSGFPLTEEDQLHFNKFIASEAHKRNLAVGLKNDLDQVDDLVYFFDFSVNEQCFEYNECGKLQPFIRQSKPVFNVEYNKKYVNDEKSRNELCKKSRKRQFTTLILPVNLDDSYRFSCVSQ